jgi:hypothetical protein
VEVEPIYLGATLSQDLCLKGFAVATQAHDLTPLPVSGGHQPLLSIATNTDDKDKA